MPFVNIVRPSADRLFSSIARRLGDRAVCVVPAGHLPDGSADARDISDAEGRVLAQNDCKRYARVPHFENTGLCEQQGSREYRHTRDFRQKLAKWLREVKAWWPDCPAVASPDGQFLMLSSARNSSAINTAQIA